MKIFDEVAFISFPHILMFSLFDNNKSPSSCIYDDQFGFTLLRINFLSLEEDILPCLLTPHNTSECSFFDNRAMLSNCDRARLKSFVKRFPNTFLSCWYAICDHVIKVIHAK